MRKKLDSKKEIRILPMTEFRVSKVNGRRSKIEGYAAVFDKYSEDMGFLEKISSGAFQQALKKSDARALFNHDPNYVLGRQSAGTLVLKEDQRGLFMSVTPPDTQWAKDLMASIERGDIKEQSFGFTVAADEWEDLEGEKPLRTIIEIDRIFDTGPVTFAAYNDTEVAVRSLEKVKKGKSTQGSRTKSSKMRTWDEICQEVDKYSNKNKKSQHKEKTKDMDEFDKIFAGKDLFQSNAEFLRAVYQADAPGKVIDPRFTRAAGLNQQIGSEGGFLVKPELMDNFLYGETSSDLYKLCSRFPVFKAISEVSFPRISETSREEGSAFGGACLYFVEEAGAITASIPKFAAPTMRFKKAIGYAPVTDELLEDLPLLEKVLSNIFGQATRYTLDHCILRGSGAGEPLGIINSSAAIVIAKAPGQNADTIITENILTMLSSLPAESMNKAVWIVNPEILKELYPLAVASGAGGVSVPLWGFKKGDEKYNTLAGLPVIPNEHCSKLGDKGDIVLADLSQYVIIEKKIRETISAHIRFEYDESAYRLVYKFDSQPLWNAPITPKHANSGEKISPFVVLADRA